MSSFSLRLLGLAVLQICRMVSYAQSEDAGLKVGERFERELAAGDVHSYQLVVIQDQFVDLVVDQRGIDVEVTVFGPDGSILLKADAPKGRRGAERVALVTDRPGIYRVEVKAIQKDAAAGRYELKLVELREATPRDPANILAGKLFEEARLIDIEASWKAGPERQTLAREALAKFQQSLTEFRRAENLRGESSALNEIALVKLNLGDTSGGILDLESSIALKLSIADKEGAGRVLTNLGLAYRGMRDYSKAEHTYKRALALFSEINSNNGKWLSLQSLGTLPDPKVNTGKPWTIICAELSLLPNGHLRCVTR